MSEQFIQTPNLQNITNQDLQIFATFGPTCHRVETLEMMLNMGMTGIRLNLSHSTLEEKEYWVKNLHQACANTHKPCHIMLDLVGRQRRLGKFEPFHVRKGEIIKIPERLPISGDLLIHFEKGDELHIGDSGHSLVLLEQDPQGNSWTAQALEDSYLESGKSIHLLNKDSTLPILYAQDIENIKICKEYGVDQIMVPLVQNAQDLEEIRKVMNEYIPHATMFAKIENMEGVRHLHEIMNVADVIVIARGDLAASTSLEWLPVIATYIQQECLKANKPYMMVTQMLYSMITEPRPTRAEVSDVYNAVLQGASAVMLTGETANSKNPRTAMDYFCKIAHHAKELRDHPEKIHELIAIL